MHAIDALRAPALIGHLAPLFVLAMLALLPSAATSGMVGNSIASMPLMSRWPLPMMPMRLNDILLPGETSRLLLTEDAHFHLMHAARSEHDGHFGQLLSNERGRHEAVSPLLRIIEVDPVDSGAAWVEVAAVGRLKIDSFDLSPDVGYDRAAVTSYTDLATAGSPSSVSLDDWMEPSAAQLETEMLRSAHEACCTLETRIKEFIAADKSMFTCEICPRSASCHLNRGYRFSLDTLIDARQAVLAEGAAAADGAAQPHIQSALWGRSMDEAAVEQQVTSFAACSALSTKARRLALVLKDTDARLAHATRELKERQLELSAELSLRAAFATH